MNVQKDDLAVIIMPPLNGKLVKVIDRAPTGRDFTLPDGYVHKKTDGDWIIGRAVQHADYCGPPGCHVCGGRRPASTSATW
jgi:hypothetical protein